MKFAAVIENKSDAWHLTFPDVPGYARQAKFANALMMGIEERLFEALHAHLSSTGGLPAASHKDGLIIHVPPLDAARLALTQALHQLGATTPEGVAKLLGIGVADAAQILDPLEWMDANLTFRSLQKLGVSCELAFDKPEAEPARAKAPPTAKKRGRPKARAAKTGGPH